MDRFYPHLFIELARGTGALRRMQTDTPMSESLDLAREVYTDLAKDCAALDFSASAATIGRILALLDQQPPPTLGQVSTLADELHGRMFDEMKGKMFLFLTMREEQEYSNPRKDWSQIIDKFPGTVRDIEEAGKCLALGRNTASVFHLMRVAECGLRSLGKALGDPNLDPKKNPAWDRILARSEKELQKPHKDRSPGPIGATHLAGPRRMVLRGLEAQGLGARTPFAWHQRASVLLDREVPPAGRERRRRRASRAGARQTRRSGKEGRTFLSVYSHRARRRLYP